MYLRHGGFTLPLETGTTCGDYDTRQNKQDLAMYRNKLLTRHLKCLLFAALFLAITFGCKSVTLHSFFYHQQSATY